MTKYQIKYFCADDAQYIDARHIYCTKYGMRLHNNRLCQQTPGVKICSGDFGYGKSGFTFASDYGNRYHGLPEGTDSSFFLCRELISGYLDGITGEYALPKGYFVDEAEAEAFDAAFPPKEKLRLPRQIF